VADGDAMQKKKIQGILSISVNYLPRWRTWHLP